MKTREKQWNENWANPRTPVFAKYKSVNNNNFLQHGERDLSSGILDEYLVEVETSRFPEIAEVDLDKMKEGYQNKNTK